MKPFDLFIAILFHCIRVGRFFGIDVKVHWSFWLLPAGVAIASLPLGGLAVAKMVGAILLFYGCVVLHEYGHALAGRAYGIRTRDIILTPLGGIALMEEMPRNPLDEIVIALAGPAVNVVLAFFLVGAILLIGQPMQLHMPPQTLMDLLVMLLFGNIGMALFNMLPAFPSDGGRVLRAFLSLFLNRLPATQVAVYLGTFIAIGMGLLGFFSGAIQLPFIAVLFALIGQMELAVLRRQEQTNALPAVESLLLSPFHASQMSPPEFGFSGYAWDARISMWVEWRDGRAVRKCRVNRL